MIEFHIGIILYIILGKIHYYNNYLYYTIIFHNLFNELINRLLLKKESKNAFNIKKVCMH